MTHLVAIALVACEPPSMNVLVRAGGGVPGALTTLHLELQQNGGVVGDLRVDAGPLPGNFGVNSSGATRGRLQVRVEGLVGARVVAEGGAEGELGWRGNPPVVEVVLLPVGGTDGGGCGPASCPSGCCGPAGCIPYTSQTPATCGAAGAACAACPDGGSCSSGACCAAGFTRCGQTCVDLRDDSANCGACAKVCPSSRACSGGQCLCSDPGDNVDGHCCPGGMQFLKSQGSALSYCYLGGPDGGPRGARQQDAADLDCRTAVSGVFACAGGAKETWGYGQGAPRNVCGWFFDGQNLGGKKSVAYYEGQQSNCAAGCSATAAGTCTTCPCACPGGAVGCTQPYFCVYDPLAPRAKPCVYDANCPPGTRCASGGDCRPAPQVPCCGDVDCDGGACTSRAINFPVVTGKCL